MTSFVGTNTVLKQVRMDHEPDVLNPGVTWQVTQLINNTGTTSIPGGFTVSKTFYRGVEVNSNRVDMCDVVVGGCPIRPGVATSKSPRTQISRFSPKGEYNVITRGSDRNGKELSCVEWKFYLV